MELEFNIFLSCHTAIAGIVRSSWLIIGVWLSLHRPMQNMNDCSQIGLGIKNLLLIKQKNLSLQLRGKCTARPKDTDRAIINVGEMCVRR